MFSVHVGSNDLPMASMLDGCRPALAVAGLDSAAVGADWLLLWFLHCPGPAVKLFLGFVAGRPLWGSCPLYLGTASSPDWQSNCSCRWRGA